MCYVFLLIGEKKTESKVASDVPLLAFDKQQKNNQRPGLTSEGAGSVSSPYPRCESVRFTDSGKTICKTQKLRVV